MEKYLLDDIKRKVGERTASKCDKRHNLGHLQNVTKNALTISKEHSTDTALMEAICYVHDLTYTIYDPGIKTYFLERKYITWILVGFLKEFDISGNEKNIIINACGKHTHSFPFRRLNKKGDIYTKILQDADTLEDFDEERIDSFFENLPGFLSPLKRLFKRMIRPRFINFFLNLPRY